MNKRIFAQDTSVSVRKSRDEIESLLKKFGADRYGYGEGIDGAHIMFEFRKRMMRFVLPLPDSGTQSAREQLSRSRWRALFLCIKAKLVCVDAGISEIDEEFLANIVTQNGQTVAQIMLPQIHAAAESGRMPTLQLTGPETK